MLRLLLDENISRTIAVQLKKRCPEMEIQSIHDWENGRYLGDEDREILKEAADQRLTLVTCDQNTILTHMADLVAEGYTHGGIILVDEHTIPQRDVGRLVRALCWLWKAERMAKWENRTLYLRSAPND